MTTSQDKECLDTRDFGVKMKMPVSNIPTNLDHGLLIQRCHLIMDKIELLEQSGDFDDQVRALVNLVYAVKVTASMMGLTYSWGDLWQATHEDNMKKVGGESGRMIFDAIKPEGWKPTELLPILYRHGLLEKRED